jgi:hypothetical protein
MARLTKSRKIKIKKFLTAASRANISRMMQQKQLHTTTYSNAIYCLSEIPGTPATDPQLTLPGLGSHN